MAVPCTHRQGARAQIRHFLKNVQQEESTALGERLLNQALRPTASPWARSAPLPGIVSCATGRAQSQEIFTDIGLGKRLPVIVARRLAEAQDMETGRPDVVKPSPQARS